MAKKDSGPQLNRSLIDGIATLQALTLADQPVGCRELARRLEMDTTRVNRFLKTLTLIGVARQTRNRKYTTGPGIHVLAAQSLFASQLLRVSMEPLESLKRYGLIVALGILWRDNVTYLYHANPDTPAAEALGRIGLYPATASGVGMALLARQEESTVEKTYGNKEIPHFPEGLDELKAQLEVIRRQGYAYVQTHNADQHTVSVAVGDPAVCAVAVSGWIPPAATAELVTVLGSVADDIKVKAGL